MCSISKSVVFILNVFLFYLNANDTNFKMFCGKGRGFYETFNKADKLSCYLYEGFLGIKDKPKDYLNFFKRIYTQKIDLFESKNYLIPPIIHQIWIGPKPFPKKFHEWQKTIQQKHPTWKYILWTDEDLKSFKMFNQDLFDNAENYGEKADILRVEILYRFGGVYLDIDCECVKPLDDLHRKFDFYAGLRPIVEHYTAVMNGMIACKPNHPLLKKFIKYLRKNKTAQDILYRTGPPFFTKIIYKFPKLLGERGIILPPIYLSPFSNYGNRWQFSAADRILPETYIVHYWEHSWNS